VLKGNKFGQQARCKMYEVPGMIRIIKNE